MMTAAHVDTVFSGTTMVLIIMQGTTAQESRATSILYELTRPDPTFSDITSSGDILHDMIWRYLT
jgi:hypothetical protein